MSYWTKKQKEEGTAVNMRSKETVAEVLNYPILAVKERNISRETCEKYGVRTALSEKDGKTPVAHYFPYYDQQGKLSGFKKRDLTLDKHDKYHFTTIGKVGVDSKLFGQDVAERVERRRANCIYVEGEWDVLSSYQALVNSVEGTKFEGLEPFVVGLNCGTTHSAESTLHNKNFVCSFDTITLAFDSDEATALEQKKGVRRGAEAKDDVANALVGEGLGLFSISYPNGSKDSSDMLQQGNSGELAKLLQFGKQQYSPQKIVNAASVSFEELISPRSQGVIVDCFPELMKKLNGFRTKELTMLLAPSNVGKSTVCSILAHQFMKAGHKIGMIFLEEGTKETLQRIVAAELGVNYLKFMRDPKSVATERDIQTVYDDIVGNDKIHMLNHFGSIPINDLLNKVKHLVLVCGCKYLLLDHISAVVSGLDGEHDDRKSLDIAMTLLAAFCAANEVHLIVVSHINRTDSQQFLPPKGKEGESFWVNVRKESARGSAALEQFSWNIIALEPEINADFSRGRVRLKVLKTRFGDSLGIADVFTLDEETWEVILDKQEVVGF